MTVYINGTTGIDKVQDGVVTSASIADGAVTPTDLSTGKPSWDSSGNLQFNSGYGSVATAYGCRAWVNFNGTGTVAIRASGNVSSITDNGTGDYTVNFTNAMPDANYSLCGTCYAAPTSDSGAVVYQATNSTSSTTIYAAIPGTAGASAYSKVDTAIVSISIFR